MKLILIFFFIFLGALAAAQVSFADDFHVAEKAAGSDSGSNCANAHSLDWFNSGTNWANPKQPGKIGPGDTVHLCGTFIGGAGTNGLIVGAPGTEGNPITIKFEKDAILQAPYWGTNDGTNPSGGAIVVGGNSWIIIDGGTNGRIQNMLNGTNGAGCTVTTCPGGTCTQKGITAGVFVGRGAHDVEIKNLTITDMFVRSPCTSTDCDGGIAMPIDVFYAGSNIRVHHNVTTYGSNVFSVNYDGNISSWEIDHNIMSLNTIPLVVVTAYGKVLSGLSIHDNEIKDPYVGLDPDNNHHLNGMMIFCSNAANGGITGTFYNNYVHGNFGTNLCGFTDHISNWVQWDFANSPSGCCAQFDIYNNLLVADTPGDKPMNGFIGVRGRPSSENQMSIFNIWNNTIVGQGLNYGLGLGEVGDETIKVQNNIIKNVGYAMYVINTVSLTSNHNLASQIGLMPGAFATVVTGEGWASKTLAEWKALGYDTDVIQSDPLLNANYTLQSASPAKDAGATLATFSSDKSGISRPQGPAWDIGAYEYVPGPDTTPPAAPTGLRVN